MSTAIVRKPKELQFLETLSKRKRFTSKEKRYYFNLQRGFEGELLFSQFIGNLKNDSIILTDLLLEYNQTTFQVDCLLITRSKIYLYEVKNFEGDYYFDNDKFYKIPRQEIINPFHQLSRAESILRQMLLSIGSNTPIESHVVFVHPTFFLYQSPLDIPAIFPNQIERHVSFLMREAGNVTATERRLASRLVELAKKESPFQKLPEVEYAELDKGITCTACEGLSMRLVKRTCVCGVCGYKESVTTAVLRSISEFQLLFPNERLTTHQIFHWCGELVPKNIIYRVLSTNFKSVGTKKWTHYV